MASSRARRCARRHVPRPCVGGSCRSRASARPSRWPTIFVAQSRDTWATGDPCGIDIAAIEHLDARSLALVREDGVDRRLNLTLPADASVVAAHRARAFRRVLIRRTSGSVLGDRARSRGAPIPPSLASAERSTATARWTTRRWRCRPIDTRAAAFAELREAVPSAVNRRVALARQQIDPRISKTAADMIVPFDRFDEMMTALPAAVRRAQPGPRGLGTHLRWQRPSQPDPRELRRCDRRT